MTAMKYYVITYVMLCCAVSSYCESIVLHADNNGIITWTNTVVSNALYRIEWASRPGGPWHKFSYQPMSAIDGSDETSFSAAVPVFYRVVLSTNNPPAGMAWIDCGDVEIGDANGVGESNELPVHTNYISGFWIDSSEVSKTKWDEVYKWATNNGYVFASAGNSKTNNHPINWVSWYDSVKWCNARSQKDGLVPCYYTSDDMSAVYTQGNINISNNCVNWFANGFRLPTEAEWEKAARGGRKGHLFPWGWNTISHYEANYFSCTNIGCAGREYDLGPTGGYHPDYYDGEEPYTSPIGSFIPNSYGLHDMSGNVFEWCWDRSGAYSSAYEIDPKGPDTGSGRVVRGGASGYEGYQARCSFRTGWGPATTDLYIGFRCVRK